MTSFIYCTLTKLHKRGFREECIHATSPAWLVYGKHQIKLHRLRWRAHFQWGRNLFFLFFPSLSSLASNVYRLYITSWSTLQQLMLWYCLPAGWLFCLCHPVRSRQNLLMLLVGPVSLTRWPLSPSLFTFFFSKKNSLNFIFNIKPFTIRRICSGD